jgi:hypothetical protein
LWFLCFLLDLFFVCFCRSVLVFLIQFLEIVVVLNRKKSYLEVFSFEIEIGFFCVADWIL